MENNIKNDDPIWYGDTGEMGKYEEEIPKEINTTKNIEEEGVPIGYTGGIDPFGDAPIELEQPQYVNWSGRRHVGSLKGEAYYNKLKDETIKLKATYIATNNQENVPPQDYSFDLQNMQKSDNISKASVNLSLEDIPNMSPYDRAVYQNEQAKKKGQNYAQYSYEEEKEMVKKWEATRPLVKKSVHQQIDEVIEKKIGKKIFNNGDILFALNDYNGNQFIQFKHNGDIFIKGELIVVDGILIEGLRQLLKMHKLIP